jgi:hypothetical protein
MAAINSTNFKVKISALQALSSPLSFENYETLSGDAETIIKMMMKNLLDSIKSLDLNRIGRDEQQYVDQFFVAIDLCLKHFKHFLEFEYIENEIKLLCNNLKFERISIYEIAEEPPAC